MNAILAFWEAACAMRLSMRSRDCSWVWDWGEACWRSAILMFLFGIVLRPCTCYGVVESQ